MTTNATSAAPEQASPLPKVSILIPLYNTREDHLRDAVDSILNQTFTDFELVIVDDGSTDPHIMQTIRSYDDTRIRFFVNPKNLGISSTRNRLLDLARGEYLAIMDHDDVSLPDRLQKQVAYLDANPQVGVLSCFAEYFQDRHGVWCYPVEDEDIRQALMLESVVIHSAAMLRKRVLVENGIHYEERFSPAEDYALWCSLISCTRFHNLPEVLLRYRWHATNCSVLQNEKMERAKLLVLNFARSNHPALFGMVRENVVRTTRIKLFGCIPLMKIVKQIDTTEYFMFGLPFARARRSYRFDS